MDRVILRFKGASGTQRCPPSHAMHHALMLLSEADELQPLFLEADRAGKFVTIEVFQSHDGKPLLIHFTMKEAA